MSSVYIILKIRTPNESLMNYLITSAKLASTKEMT